MRFLYGDTEPFPPQYDFLAALEAFMTNASRAVQLDAEVRGLREAAAAVEAKRAKSVEALAAFHQTRMRSLAQALPIDAEEPSRDYVRRLSELAASIVDTVNAASAQASELARQQLNAEVDRRRGEIRASVAAFLRVLRLPASSTHSSMRLHEGHNDLSATIVGDDGIAIAFALTTRDHPSWQVPRKVSDFAQGFDLPISVRKGWFSKGVQAGLAHIDDYVIGGFEIAGDAAEFHLRKKAGEKDTLVIDVKRGEGGKLSAEVHHPGDPEAEGHAGTLDADALGHLERLWEGLGAAAEDVSGHRERVLSVTMNGEDVVEHDHVGAFVEAVIRQIAPTVIEIAKRSSSTAELALKAESEKGRREELYVRKADLLKHLEPLAAAERAIFTPLALVPAATPSSAALPPPVASTAPVASAAPAAPTEPRQQSGPDDGAWDVDVADST